MKTIAVILAGCGNRDGSETHETLSALLAVDKRGMQYQCFAPQGEFSVYNHMEGKPSGEKRNIMIEASRLCRGEIKPLSAYKAEDFDALLLPGGMGAAQNWSNYAFEGENMQVNAEVAEAVRSTNAAGKPIAAMCIAPMILAKLLGDKHPTLTLGKDCPAAEHARKLGCKHQICTAEEVAVDKENKIITTPAYMVATHIAEIFAGADKMVEELTKLIA